MKKITNDELKKILTLHKRWLNREEGGIHADLSHADLSYADLIGADLSYANLSYVDLNSADLSYANLSYADLNSADLRCADLIGTDLSHADLRCADLGYSNLSDTDLNGANLRGANLSDIKYNEITTFLALQCPEEGSFIGYKKAHNKIIKLLITEDAKRSSATSRKCRCSKAKVLSITNIDGTESNITSISSNYDNSFIYKIGEIVEVHNFDENRWNECSTGIHFFITREEAVKYR